MDLSFVKSFARAALVPKPGLKSGQDLGAFEREPVAFRPDPDKVSAYREVCGFSRSAGLPIPYPQVLAAPVHLAMLTDPDFPLPAMGLVHVRNRITQTAVIPEDAELLIGVRIEGTRTVKHGIEFDIHTTVEVDGAEIWTGTAVTLCRRKVPKGAESERAEPAAPEPGARELRIEVGEGTGRAYAGVSGDWNPIHVHALSAKPLGFKRAVAHGMWTMARCAAELDAVRAIEEADLRVSFRRPVFLPSSTRMLWDEADGVRRFVLYPVAQDKPYLLGALRG